MVRQPLFLVFYPPESLLSLTHFLQKPYRCQCYQRHHLLVVWSSPAATSEIYLVRQSDLLPLVHPGQRIPADGGFGGEDSIVVPFKRAVARLNPVKALFNKRLSGERWRVEASCGFLSFCRPKKLEGVRSR